MQGETHSAMCEELRWIDSLITYSVVTQALNELGNVKQDGVSWKAIENSHGVLRCDGVRRVLSREVRQSLDRTDASPRQRVNQLGELKKKRNVEDLED